MPTIARVDPAGCEGHGLCIVEAPAVFETDDDGYASASREPIPDELRDVVERAVRACPAGAISMGPA